jgi:osmoprotectant transport system ATP-binding protein
LRRRIGYAIQHIGLFPHMTVGENIAVVPNLLQWPRDRVAQRVDEMLEMVGLGPEEFRHRFPAQLSGGQQQRVGVARALAADPPVVLMDEPFGALDPITREQLQNEFIELQSRIRKTVIFVTHDVFEAVKVGDRIALMDAGQLQQVAPPAELVDAPTNDFVDQFLGQHRFQLALLTRTIKSVLPPQPATLRQASSVTPEPHLRARDSIIEGLDAFKKSRTSVLPVYEGDRLVGRVSRDQILAAVSQVLAERQEDS